MRTLLGSLILGASLIAGPRPAAAQVARPPVASYTTAQADAGKVIFEQNCANCHGADLTGGEGPPLVGAPFLYNWNGQRVEGLIKFVQMNMPASAPGTLTPESSINAIAFILSRNKLAAGDNPLTANSSGIVLAPPEQRP
jgi:mono/diheme cytochrome c family protein